MQMLHMCLLSPVLCAGTSNILVRTCQSAFPRFLQFTNITCDFRRRQDMHQLVSLRDFPRSTVTVAANCLSPLHTFLP